VDAWQICDILTLPLELIQGELKRWSLDFVAVRFIDGRRLCASSSWSTTARANAWRW
jgi:hypothetical protein